MLANASQQVPIYLQPFLRYSGISVASDWFSRVHRERMSVFTTFFAFPWVRLWYNRGKCYMDRKRIQCLSNASQHVPIYLQPFLRYSKLLVENCDIFTPHLCLAVTPSEFREDLDTHKTRMNGLSCGEEGMTIRSAVLIQYQRVTDGQTDEQTDGQTSSLYLLRASAQLTQLTDVKTVSS